MAAPQISVIRGILIPADKVLGLEDFERIEVGYPKLAFAAPIDFGYFYYDDGEAVVAVGVYVGPPYGHDFGVVKVGERGELTLMDRYYGTPRTLFQCELTDGEIVMLLNEGGFVCHEGDLATYIVCWFG